MKFTAPFIAALAALGGVADAQRAVCDRNNYASVARQILNPVYFCKFYLAQKRTASPLKQFGPKQLTNLCRCFVQNAPRVRGPYRVLRPKPPPAVCKMTLYRSLTNQYRDPASFCRFYLRDVRFLSPMVTITNPATVKKACRCFLERRFAAQTTTTRRTTTRRTTTPSRTPTTTPETTPETTPTAEPTTTDSPVETTTSDLPTTDLPTLLPTTDLPTLLPTTTSTTDSAAAESTSSTITQSADLSSTTSSSRAASSSSSSSSSAGP